MLGNDVYAKFVQKSPDQGPFFMVHTEGQAEVSIQENEYGTLDIKSMSYNYDVVSVKYWDPQMQSTDQLEKFIRFQLEVSRASCHNEQIRFYSNEIKSLMMEYGLKIRQNSDKNSISVLNSNGIDIIATFNLILSPENDLTQLDYWIFTNNTPMFAIIKNDCIMENLKIVLSLLAQIVA